MNRPKENKEECCCEGTITREGAIHTKNSCCVYIENKEESNHEEYVRGCEDCRIRSSPQTPELKGNKFTWKKIVALNVAS